MESESESTITVNASASPISITSNANEPTTSSGIEIDGTSSKDILFETENRLQYEIHRYTSFSTNYFPENILIDVPSDQTSRWSPHSNSPPQYLILKMKRPAIVRKIKFGKYEKSHVCNIKKFRILGGLDEDNMVLLLEAGLKNDNIPEVFNLRCRTEDGADYMPILYLKIVPLLSWGPTFNFSIWFVELQGQDDPMYTGPSLRNYNKLREVEIVRLCLKHFRQQGYNSAFRALQSDTQVQLEGTLVTDLYKCLVVNGDFKRAEDCIAQYIEGGLMDEYLNGQDYKHIWRMQSTASEAAPGNRGGHQLVLDYKKRLMYLYGGWDGFQDLSDLWVYDIADNSWLMLFEHTEQFKGPTPRSCHKMVYDPLSENIFMIGRYLDNSIRTTEYVKSDFFLYDTRANSWLQISDDTSQVFGPRLVYDHQMCIDAEKRTIYVFGGKILTPRSVTNCVTSEPEYSGLFSYHIPTDTWTQILVDCHHPTAAQPEVLSIKSRITHCMVFNNKNRKLYIYGGQRGKEDINEFFTYDVDTQSISLLNGEQKVGVGGNSGSGNGSSNNTLNPEPSPGYTLRCTIDHDRDEIYIFSSLSKVKDRRDMQNIDASNSFWVYSLRTQKWSHIYTYQHNPNATNVCAKEGSDNLEPCPRYAHQFVYDDVAKIHYLFGGNPGRAALPQLRLDDFWILSLEKPKRMELLTHCRFLLRKLRYEEMTQSDPYQAMQYLRVHVAEVIDRSNTEQLNNFHKLAALLFKTDDSGTERPLSATPPLGKQQFTNAGERDNDFNMTAAMCDTPDEDCSHKSDSAGSNTADDLSLESCESGATDAASYSQYRKSGGKRARHDFLYALKSRRSFLFNKLTQMLPKDLVPPERNLSDFVVM